MTARRRRLLCVMQLPPPVHGVTVVNQAVARSELVAARFDIEVLPIVFARSFEELDRASLHKLGALLQTAWQLAHALLARRPHAVYFTLTPTGAAFYRDCVLVAVMKLARVRRIYHLHGRVTPQRARWQRALYRWAFRDAWVIQLSERFVADLAGFVPRERVHVVPNGVARPSAPSAPGRAGGARVLYFSNLTESKGPLVLIEALAILRARGIRFVATFAGAVHDPAFLGRCRARIRRHGLDPQVRYVGPAYAERKQQLLDEHDVFVLPTCRDAFPLVALEAMQAGIPVVTTRVGALPEIVVEGVTGFLVPPGDPAALATRIAMLISDRDMQRRMGAQGRSRFLQKYTHAAFEQRLVTALGTCVEPSTGRE